MGTMSAFHPFQTLAQASRASSKVVKLLPVAASHRVLPFGAVTRRGKFLPRNPSFHLVINGRS
jgi:hypothetical protein